ncbi:MAG: hypothetical protein PHE79_01890 [Eubacteriales bacterium]|nr:hypothetical protein [Eubacteriales bacterium]
MSSKDDTRLNETANEANDDGDNKMMYEILKFKNQDIEETVVEETGEKSFCISISEDKLDKKTTLVRESEIIRIIKALDIDDCKPRKDKNGRDSDFPFVKDLIAINVSTKQYKKNNEGIITLKIEKKVGSKTRKKEYRFIRLLASTSNIRNKKIIYIKENLYDKVNEILLCGMPTDMEHKQFSKYSAYYALASTDSIPVTMPNLVVINDYKNRITGACDLVQEEIIKGEQRFRKSTGKPLLDKKTGEPKFKNDTIKYSVDNNINHIIEENKPFDGAGLVDVSLANIWAAEMHLDYLPSAFQFRAIPGIKGNLYVFDFQKFADEFHNNVRKDKSNKIVIQDAWNKEIQLLNEDGSLAINVILTKSQYKFYDYLDFDTWKEEFVKECYGYKRTFNISGRSVKFEDIKREVLLSYQPLQSLDISLAEIQKLCECTVERIKKISTNVKEFLKYRGLLDAEENERGERKSKRDIPPYYKALMKNPEMLFADKYIQSKVQSDIKRFKENTYKGAVLVPGNYQTLMPDIFALAQWAFGIMPTGLLVGDQVYSRYWLSQKVTEIDIIRFPHIANEHSIGKVVDINKSETIKTYYKYATEGIITAIDSFIPLKANSADFDGDHVLTNSSAVLIDMYKSQKSNTVVHIPANRDENTEKKAYKINDMTKTIDTDINGMSNSIGRVVNQITRLWSQEKSPEVLDYIKIMNVIGSLTIDFVKTGEKAAIPTDIKKYLQNVKKPDFMRVIYPKIERKEKDTNRIRRINKQAEIRLFGSTDCTMNRIYKYMKSELEQIKIEHDESEFEYKILMENSKPNIAGNKSYPMIVETLLELKKEYNSIVQGNSMDDESDEYNDEKKQDHDYKFRIFNSYARKTLLTLCTPKNQMTKEKLLDYLVYAHYYDKTFANNEDRNIIWNCFGREFNERLEYGTNTKFKEIDHEANEKSLKKQKSIIHRIKSDNKTVIITSLRPNEGDPQKEITIFQSEIDYIKQNFLSYKERKMAFVLIIMDKFCKAYEEPFDIYNGKKNRISKSSLLNLSDVHSRDYEIIMEKLVEQQFIRYTQIGNTTTVICTILPEIKESGCGIKLTDVNQCKKYLRKLN